MSNETAVERFAKAIYETFEMKGDGNVFDNLLAQAKTRERRQMKKQNTESWFILSIALAEAIVIIILIFTK